MRRETSPVKRGISLILTDDGQFVKKKQEAGRSSFVGRVRVASSYQWTGIPVQRGGRWTNGWLDARHDRSDCPFKRPLTGIAW